MEENLGDIGDQVGQLVDSSLKELHLGLKPAVNIHGHVLVVGHVLDNIIDCWLLMRNKLLNRVKLLFNCLVNA